MSIIRVGGLTKGFRVLKKKEKGFFPALSSLFSRNKERYLALDNLSFSIKQGELVGFIGPNGAGKSTTIKILSGILVPDSGIVHVFGKTPWEHRKETVRKLGVLFGQKSQLWWDLPVIESFKLLKDIYALSNTNYSKSLEKLSSVMDIFNFLHISPRNLSLGQRVRCDIVASLLHSPEILFLDEPTIGLDAMSKLAVRDCIKHLNRENNVTIVLTTHDMDDIEALCSRVLIMNKGALCFDGSLQELRKSLAPERWLIVDLLREYDTISDPEASVIKQEGHRVWLRFNPSSTMTPELISRITRNHAVTDLYVENPPIEECIARIYKR